MAALTHGPIASSSPTRAKDSVLAPRWKSPGWLVVYRTGRPSSSLVQRTGRTQAVIVSLTGPGHRQPSRRAALASPRRQCGHWHGSRWLGFTSASPGGTLALMSFFVRSGFLIHLAPYPEVTPERPHKFRSFSRAADSFGCSSPWVASYWQRWCWHLLLDVAGGAGDRPFSLPPSCCHTWLLVRVQCCLYPSPGMGALT